MPYDLLIIFARSMPSILQFFCTFAGVPSTVLEKTIHADKEECKSFAEAKRSGFRCIDVFNRATEVMLAVVGIEGTLLICALLPANPYFRWTALITALALGSVYFRYMNVLSKDKRRIRVFTRLSKRTIIRKLSKTITHTDVASIISAVSGVVAAILAETLSGV